jgi:hypothetical protein
VGGVSYPLRLETDEIGHEERSARASGFVLTTIDEIRPTLDFGSVYVDGEIPSKSITLSSNESPHVRMEKVLEAPAWLHAEIRDNALSVTPDKDTPLGLNDGYVKVSLAPSRQPQAWVLVKADIRGDIIPAANPFDMGLMHLGNKNQQLIRLDSRSGKAIKIKQVSLRSIEGKVKVVSCPDRKAGCKMLQLTLSDQQPTGFMKGWLHVAFADSSRDLTITVNGMLLAKDQEVKPLIPTAEGSEGDQNPSPSSTVAKSNDVDKLIKEAIDASDTTPSIPTGKGPLLKWITTDGTDVHGFQVFRSSAENGDFVLMTAKTLLADPHKDRSSTYWWRDDSAKSGETYWYYVGIVKTDGSKQRLTPPQKATAK